MSQWEQVLELERQGRISLYVPFFPLQSDQAYLGQQLFWVWQGFGCIGLISISAIAASNLSPYFTNHAHWEPTTCSSSASCRMGPTEANVSRISSFNIPEGLKTPSSKSLSQMRVCQFHSSIFPISLTIPVFSGCLRVEGSGRPGQTRSRRLGSQRSQQVMVGPI